MMLRTFLFMILFVSSIGAAANGEKPKPPTKPPVVAGDSDSGNRELAIALTGIAALVGIVIYIGNEKKQKVAVQPTPDLKGATATVEWRF